MRINNQTPQKQEIVASMSSFPLFFVPKITLFYLFFPIAAVMAVLA